MSESIVITGNAAVEGERRRGWLLGHFREPGPHHSTDVEVKWGVHLASERRKSSGAPDARVKTLSVLIDGQFTADFKECGQIHWDREGDYFFWTHNLPHSAEMLKDTIVLTLRWPSMNPIEPKLVVDDQPPITLSGNAALDAAAGDGWILGLSPSADSPLHTEDVGLKWSTIKQGIRRESPHKEIDGVWSLLLLVRGKLKLSFGDRVHSLENRGDYVLWNNNQPHANEASEDSVCITIRWPLRLLK